VHILLIILGALLALFGGGCALLTGGYSPEIWLLPLAGGILLIRWGMARGRAKRENLKKME
jgi:Flp pilus assembly protein TadB